MKDQNFSIKISDLLDQTWMVDEVRFENKFSSQLPNLTKEWISWTFLIQSLNDTSLLGTLKDVHCSINDVCDSCQESFVRKVDIPEYTARFVVEDEQTEIEKEEKAEEEIFSINAGYETINVEDMVVHAIVLQEPIVKRCAACEKKLEHISDDDELDDTLIGNWNITFS